ncbi:3'-5' exonuclease [Bradyrhizobium japonicum]|uniref:3'-5' exonuclease n=1 Tax=Bradyrhizobium japonicum TaxID=375 RepID=UPI001BA47D8E|nr:3'-5' exonuclease [Bradyrhizobium japonicum]MBR0994532.1 3'-5' exonuclease [Bradyrhizobium japonicum]
MYNEASEALAKQLEATGQYRVLRRIAPHVPGYSSEGGAKIGIVLDVETTGLDPNRDEVIELAMIKFAYSASDRILGIIDIFQGLQEPSSPITPEITALTGITNEMVAGRAIDPLAVDRFGSEAHIILAHNSAFDRKFAERFWPVFVHKPWACSSSGIPWKEHGFASAKLEHLLAACGFFYDAHRAVDDCHALMTLLAQELSHNSTTVLAGLLERARRKTVRVWAQGAPFELKDTLKRRNYHWSDGTDGRPKSWYKDIEEEMLGAELRFLKSEIYQLEIEILRQEFTAIDRYSCRA